MKATPVMPDDIARSVWAVPPLAQNADYSINDAANRALVTHIEAGGVSTLLWGGNANIYGMTQARFADMVARLPDWAGEDSWVIPSAGPDYGKLMDQATALRGTDYPAVMLLPMTGPQNTGGVEMAVRHFHDAAALPLILYLKKPGYLPVDRVAQLFDDGVLVAVKYAVETGDFTRDPYLDSLLAECPRDRFVSGIGEIVATTHVPAFDLAGFTAGIVCIAPQRAMKVLAALKKGDVTAAKMLCEPFQELESLREEHGPIPVIHEAVTASGIADMGPLSPHFAPLDEPVRQAIAAVVAELMQVVGVQAV